MKIMRKVVQSSKPFFALLFSVVIAMMAISQPIAYAAEESNESKHYLGTVVNAGHDTGFSENNAISENDPHFGWKLGEFYVNGYTRVTEDKNGTPVFLKQSVIQSHCGLNWSRTLQSSMEMRRFRSTMMPTATTSISVLKRLIWGVAH